MVPIDLVEIVRDRSFRFSCGCSSSCMVLSCLLLTFVWNKLSFILFIYRLIDWLVVWLVDTCILFVRFSFIHSFLLSFIHCCRRLCLQSRGIRSPQATCAPPSDHSRRKTHVWWRNQPLRNHWCSISDSLQGHIASQNFARTSPTSLTGFSSTGLWLWSFWLFML